MEDLKEHIGTVIAVIAAMWGAILVLGGVIWSQVKNDISKFPNWLKDMDNKGGVVTHDDLVQDGPLMSIKSHEMFCSRVIAEVTSQIVTSEKHQGEMLELVRSQFQTAFEGQKAITDRLSKLQDSVLEILAGIKEK